LLFSRLFSEVRFQFQRQRRFLRIREMAPVEVLGEDVLNRIVLAIKYPPLLASLR
jgi:hypothetical protein